MSAIGLTKVNVRIEKSVLGTLKALAKEKKWSYNLLIRMAIDEYLKKEGKA